MDLESKDSPKCARCGKAMRLVEMEPHPTLPLVSLHTYECACGGRAVVEVALL
jgi:hypothetical protein